MGTDAEESQVGPQGGTARNLRQSQRAVQGRAAADAAAAEQPQRQRSAASTQGQATEGICAHCRKSIVAESSICTALEKSYHVECFVCYSCQMPLVGHPFYQDGNKPLCEDCYTESLEKCSTCQQPITVRILRTEGKAYHVGCFICFVCHRRLDAVPFTVDSDNQVYCIDDFRKKHAPTCSVCRLPILPEPGHEDIDRIVALGRNFHISCFKCEGCGLLLSSDADGPGCYPLEGHVLCESCNSKGVEKTAGRR